MALISPGVQVSVIDESFYTPAEPGTRPLFIVASAANKRNSSDTGIALGTTPANLNKVYTITSQRELAETFGDPTFRIDVSGNPIHAGELNEYGLQAAYSYLGVSNSCLILRADVDLNALTATSAAPVGAPADGTFWLDTAASAYGIFQWNGATAVNGGQLFANKVPTVFSGVSPAVATGAVGDYGVFTNVTGALNAVTLYYRSEFTDTGLIATPTWVQIGTEGWLAAWPTVKGSTAVLSALTATEQIGINGVNTAVPASPDNTLAGLVTAINANVQITQVKARVVGGRLELFSTDLALTGIAITGDTTLLTALGLTLDTFPTPKITTASHTTVPQYKIGATDTRPTGSLWIKTTEPNAGARWRIKYYNAQTQLWEQLLVSLYPNDTAANAALNPTGTSLTVKSVYIQYTNTGTFVARRWNGTAWVDMPVTGNADTDYYFVSGTAPSTLVASGKLWYNSVIDQIDLLVHNGTTWVGINAANTGYTTAEVIVSASTPVLTTQQQLVDKHIWVDASDLENYPVMRRWNAAFKRWDSVDKSDQTTEDGVLFADARWSAAGADAAAGAISVLRTSTYIDVDAPDPALYPQGMILWNTRRSGFNVKKFVRNHVDTTADNIRQSGNPAMTDYYPHRWVTESANRADGSGSFGRHAQRKVVVQALQAITNSNDDIRDVERNAFNLIACPGYPELIDELLNLNQERGLSSFVVGDSPARLLPNATSLNRWATNVAGSAQNDDAGLVSSDEYLGVFYPWGITSDNAGRDVVVPPSHMICRTIALSDQVAYPWFAPAGTRRGTITNASNVGYVSTEGEFVPVALNEGQRDTLYTNKVNPITFFVGSGLVNFGQKTRAPGDSAMDRINVSRLVVYLRSQLNRLAKPYIFEPNDKITRDQLKQQVESLLVELVGQRALYDFLVVCDESNNTPNRIDRNELYLDIAIEPVKAVEFIYIPLRLKNTGEIAGL
jgi:hypothetical protein